MDRVNELIAVDMGSLVEDKGRREKVRSFLLDSRLLALISTKRKWPEEKIFIGLESIRNFNVRAKVVGPTVSVQSFDIGASHEPSTGHVRQIYTARNGDSRADKRSRVRLCGPGNGEGVGRTYAYSHNVRLKSWRLNLF